MDAERDPKMSVSPNAFQNLFPTALQRKNPITVQQATTPTIVAWKANNGSERYHQKISKGIDPKVMNESPVRKASSHGFDSPGSVTP